MTPPSHLLPKLARRCALAAALLALTACSELKPGTDRPDLGGPVDAGPRDLGRPMDDLGPTCPPPLNYPPLTDLPRCSAVTRDAVIACGLPTSPAAQECLQLALDGDTTTPLPGSPLIDCAYCYGYQQVVCGYAAGCEAQLNAYFCCCPGGSSTPCGACGAESRALTACFSAHISCFDISMPSPLSDCFAS